MTGFIIPDRRIFYGIVIGLMIIFNLLRLVNLKADFPPGITESGVLFADEGWYSNAAINHCISGRWFVEGDFNPAINMPMGQVIQAISFRIFGMGLGQARIAPVMSAILAILFTYFLVSKYLSRELSLLVILLLSVNFHFFAYSRLAIMDLPMICFIVGAIFTADRFRGFAGVIFGSVLLLLGYLTKSTAIFALPVLLYIIFFRGEGKKTAVIKSLIAVLIFAGGVYFYNFIAGSAYPVDFAYFKNINLADRMIGGLFEWIKSGIKEILEGRTIGLILYPASLMVIAGGVFSGEFRRNRLVRIMGVWLVSYFLLLSVFKYHPPRYFLSVTIPLIILFLTGLQDICQKAGNQWMTRVCAIIILLIFIGNGSKTVNYLFHPEYSMMNMYSGIREKIHSETSNDEDAVFLGDVAHTISLGTGIRGINSVLGTEDIDWKVAKYRPKYYIALGIDHEVYDYMNRQYKIEAMGEWDVLRNYKGRKMHLFRLEGRKDDSIDVEDLNER